MIMSERVPEEIREVRLAQVTRECALCPGRAYLFSTGFDNRGEFVETWKCEECDELEDDCYCLAPGPEMIA